MNPELPNVLMMPELTVRVVTERHILASSLKVTLARVARVSSSSSIQAVGSQTESVLVVELSSWSPEAIREAVESSSRPVVIWMLSMSPEQALCAIEQGVRGVMGDYSSEEDIVACIEAVVRGEIWVPARISSALLTRKVCKLTPREAELVALISKGLRNKEIAYLMSITEGTVKVYLSRLFDKVGVSDRFELAMLMLRGEAGTGAPETGKVSIPQARPGQMRSVFVTSPKPAILTFAATA